MGNTLVCDFCEQPITNLVSKFRHEVATANFMIGLLPDKDEMCDICYTRAKDSPPTKKEVNKDNQDRIARAEKMREDCYRFD